MTISTVGIKAATIEAIDVTDVVVTTTEEDLESGYWVREIRVFGEPPEGSQIAPQIFVLRIKSLTKNMLDVTAPSVNF